VSIGYACEAGARFDTAHQLFEAADAALYSAKELGRNAISAFQGRRNSDPPPASVDVPRVSQEISGQP
jgi:predicted signal transduction protein with EAL and GGDEF domain